MNLTGGVTILGYLIGVAGAITIIFSKVKTENLKDLQTRVELLERERQTMRDQNLESQISIANLQGQLDTYKEIPLKKIAASLDSLAKSNNKILTQLKVSADKLTDTAQADGVLVHTDENNPLVVKVENK